MKLWKRFRMSLLLLVLTLTCMLVYNQTASSPLVGAESYAWLISFRILLVFFVLTFLVALFKTFKESFEGT